MNNTITHKLMIKTHKITGLKYLCYTKSEGEKYDNYKGSGKKWKSHLKKYGDDITTELIFETSDFEEFRSFSLLVSMQLDIVDSPDWANMIFETGTGGDTVSNKRWITDGTSDKYINKDLEIPSGWVKGRTNCVFNNKDNQSKFSKMQSKDSRSVIMKSIWNDGKMKNRKMNPKYGEDNPSKRPEVREKIRLFALSESEVRSKRMKDNEVWKHSPFFKQKEDD